MCYHKQLENHTEIRKVENKPSNGKSSHSQSGGDERN